MLIYILILSNRRDVLGRAANGLHSAPQPPFAVAGISVMSLLLLGQTTLSWLGVA